MELSTRITDSPWFVSTDQDCYVINSESDDDDVYGAEIARLETAEGEEWEYEAKCNAIAIANLPKLLIYVEEMARGVYSDSNISSYLDTQTKRANKILKDIEKHLTPLG